MRTFHGGSALYLASMLDLIGKGHVLTIDITPQPNRPSHNRITYLTASSCFCAGHPNNSKHAQT